MAVLSDQDRFDVWADFMRSARDNLENIPISKADLRAAVNAADQWADDNATSFNTAIPQPARSALTAKQKARLLVWVVRRRFEIA
jgi:predicted metalloprotease